MSYLTSLRSGRLLAVASLLLLASCSDDGVGPAPDYDWSAFDAAINTLIQDEGLEGMRAAVVHRDYGVLHMQAYGSHSLDRLSLLASASKIISVGVLMHLQDEGLVDIDTPIGNYAPAFWGTRSMDFTLAQALSNSSGLVGLIDEPQYPGYVCQYGNIGALQACAGLIYGADDAADIEPPDTRFRYGGGQWQLSGGVAEVVSGMSWDDLIGQAYREPCGLSETDLGYTNQYQQVFIEVGMDGAFGYPSFVDGTIDDIEQYRNPNIEGGGYATVNAYAEILLMHLRDGRCSNGRVMSADSARRMREDRILEAYGGATFTSSMSGYGLGWWIDRDSGIISDLGAYGTAPWIDEDRGVGVVLMIEDQAETGGVAMNRIRPIVEDIIDNTP